MKTFTLSLLAITAALTVSAQTWVYTTPMHITDTTYSSTLNLYDIDFLPADSSDITFEWDLLENSFVTGWSYSLCDYGSCYTTLPTHGKMHRIRTAQMEAGVTGNFKITLNPLNIDGEGTIRLFVYDSANAGVGDTLSFHMVFTDTSSTNTAVPQLQRTTGVNVFPNPATNQVTVANVEAVGTQVSLIDLTGRVVASSWVPANTQRQLKVADLHKGIYFVRTNTTTQRLIIN